MSHPYSLVFHLGFSPFGFCIAELLLILFCFCFPFCFVGLLGTKPRSLYFFYYFCKGRCWLFAGWSSISPLTDEGGGAASDDVLRSRENLELAERFGSEDWDFRVLVWWFWHECVSVFWQLNMEERETWAARLAGCWEIDILWKRLWRSRFNENTPDYSWQWCGLWLVWSSRRFRITWFKSMIEFSTWEFDPGSERTLAAGLTHASRTPRKGSGRRVSNAWESTHLYGITQGNLC